MINTSNSSLYHHPRWTNFNNRPNPIDFKLRESNRRHSFRSSCRISDATSLLTSIVVNSPWLARGELAKLTASINGGRSLQALYSQFRTRIGTRREGFGSRESCKDNSASCRAGDCYGGQSTWWLTEDEILVSAFFNSDEGTNPVCLVH